MKKLTLPSLSKEALDKTPDSMIIGGCGCYSSGDYNNTGSYYDCYLRR